MVYPLKSNGTSTFIDYIVIANSEALGYLASGILYQKFRQSRLIIVSSLSAAAFFGLILIAFNDSSYAIAILVCLANFCAAMASNATFLATFDSFHTVFVATVFGVMQLSGRLVYIAIPFLVEVQYPIPHVVFSAVCFTCAVVVFFGLKEKERSH